MIINVFKWISCILGATVRHPEKTAFPSAFMRKFQPKINIFRLKPKYLNLYSVSSAAILKWNFSYIFGVYRNISTKPTYFDSNPCTWMFSCILVLPAAILKKIYCSQFLRRLWDISTKPICFDSKQCTSMI